MYPVEEYVNNLGPPLLQCLLENVLDVVLSTCILVGGCECPISMKVVRSGTNSCSFIIDAHISAFPANFMTFIIIFKYLARGHCLGGPHFRCSKINPPCSATFLGNQ